MKDVDIEPITLTAGFIALVGSLVGAVLRGSFHRNLRTLDETIEAHDDRLYDLEKQLDSLREHINNINLKVVVLDSFRRRNRNAEDE